MVPTARSVPARASRVVPTPDSPGEQHDPAGPGSSLRDQRIEDGEFGVRADKHAAWCLVQDWDLELVR